MPPATVQDIFGTVLFAVVGLGAVLAIVTLAMSRRSYEEIGRGGLSLHEDDDGRRHRPADAAVARREADEEIRQMLTARNARRVRRGQAPLDVEAELHRLVSPAGDPALREEVRQLVLARNARRERHGKPPLNVEAEIERQLGELG